jgi:phosphonate transport system substrate-binding protein
MSKPTRTPCPRSADVGRRRLLLGAAALLAGAAVPLARGDTPRAIEVGLIPYLPTATLIARHQPLRRHLEQAFRRPVVLSTAPDFHTFQQRVLQGAFDFVITGPGPGWQAYADRKHEVVAVSQRTVRILFIVAADSPLREFAELRGKTIATIDPLTITAQTAVTTLQEHRLRPNADVRIRHEKTPFNCAQAVILGEVAAAALTTAVHANLPAETRERLRTFHESEGFPGMLFMVRPAPNMPAPAEFQAALFRFAESDAGRAFLRELNHDGLLRPDLKELRSLDRFLPETRRIMGGA